MKFAAFLGVCIVTTLIHSSNAAPQLLQGTETAGTQHGLSLGGYNLVNFGGGYSKGAAVGAPGTRGKPHGAGAAAGGSAGFNFGLGPLQYTNQNSAAAQASYTQ